MKKLTRALYQLLKASKKSQVNKLDSKMMYSNLVETLKKECNTDQSMKLAVGGEFEAIGILELETLKYFGLKEDSYVIDIGCGSGRLAKPLSQYLKGKYLGIDIVPELISYARQIVGKPDWRFEVAEGLSIPEKDGTGDFVCFFSVFTHLLHEQSYVYLQEAKRVLKPQGKIVFSFLDFNVPSHWNVFKCNINDLQFNSHPLNMFFCKDAIQIWAEHLGLEVQIIQDGDKPFIPLSEPVAFESGAVMEKVGTIGQSTCVLQKSCDPDLSN